MQENRVSLRVLPEYFANFDSVKVAKGKMKHQKEVPESCESYNGYCDVMEYLMP